MDPLPLPLPRAVAGLRNGSAELEAYASLVKPYADAAARYIPHCYIEAVRRAVPEMVQTEADVAAWRQRLALNNWLCAICANCGSKKEGQTFQACKVCNLAFYCNDECESKHAAEHARVCVDIDRPLDPDDPLQPAVYPVQRTQAGKQVVLQLQDEGVRRLYRLRYFLLNENGERVHDEAVRIGGGVYVLPAGARVYKIELDDTMTIKPGAVAEMWHSNAMGTAIHNDADGVATVSLLLKKNAPDGSRDAAGPAFLLTVGHLFTGRGPKAYACVFGDARLHVGDVESAAEDVSVDMALVRLNKDGLHHYGVALDVGTVTAA